MKVLEEAKATPGGKTGDILFYVHGFNTEPRERGGRRNSDQLSLSGGTGTNIKIDLDGDGTADMKIFRLNTTGLTKADFLF